MCPVFAEKRQAYMLDVFSQLLVLEDPDVPAGRVVIAFGKRPADLFRPPPRHTDSQPTTRLEDSGNFIDCLFVVGNVLQHFGTDHDFKRVIGKRQIERIGDRTAEPQEITFKVREGFEPVERLFDIIKTKINAHSVHLCGMVHGVKVATLAAAQIENGIPVPELK